MAFEIVDSGRTIDGRRYSGRHAYKYEAIWKALRARPHVKIAVECDTVREAVNLAASARGHRTLCIDVQRRQRHVVLCYVPDDDNEW